MSYRLHHPVWGFWGGEDWAGNVWTFIVERARPLAKVEAERIRDRWPGEPIVIEEV